MWVGLDDCGLVVVNVVSVVVNLVWTIALVTFNVVSKLPGIAGQSDYDCGPLQLQSRLDFPAPLMQRKHCGKYLLRLREGLVLLSNLVPPKILQLNRKNMSNTTHPRPKRFRITPLCFSVVLLIIGCSPRSYLNPENISPSHTMEEAQNSRTEVATETTGQQSYVGMWVTKDGYIRHELLPNGRYDEARGQKQSAYQGSYTLTGNHIDYVDDTGFTADGEFRDGVLFHGGMVLYREENK